MVEEVHYEGMDKTLSPKLKKQVTYFADSTSVLVRSTTQTSIDLLSEDICVRTALGQKLIETRYGDAPACDIYAKRELP